MESEDSVLIFVAELGRWLELKLELKLDRRPKGKGGGECGGGKKEWGRW